MCQGKHKPFKVQVKDKYGRPKYSRAYFYWFTRDFLLILLLFLISM